MRGTGRITAIALSTLAGAAGLAPLSAQAAGTGSIINVDNANKACVDSGSTAGSAQTPYCDLSVAGLKAQPGDTVLVQPSTTMYSAPAFYGFQQPATVNGAPGNPITFKAAAPGVSINGGFYLSNQHDLVFDGFDYPRIGIGISGVHALSGADITVRNSTFTQYGANSVNGPQWAVYLDNVAGGSVTDNVMAVDQDTPGVYLSDGTSGVDVERNTVTMSSLGNSGTVSGGAQGFYSDGPGNSIVANTAVGTDGPSVQVTANGSGTLVANNFLKCGYGGVAVTGASNVAVTGNTIIGWAAAELSVSGAVKNVSVEDNIASIQDQGLQCTPTGADAPNLAGLAVDAAAAPGVTADYNNVYIPAVGTQYSWAGQTYFAAKDFTAGSGGQGAHDSIMWPHLDSTGMPEAGSVDIDSANSAAPGVQAVDRLGKGRHDDPGTANTGAGPALYYDRGAFEFQGDSSPTPVPPTPVPPAPVPPSPSPVPTGGPAVGRLGGADRYQTGILISQSQWGADKADAVVLARGDKAPDALAGVPLASHVHGPLLLTSPSSLVPETRTEIDRVLGGPSTHKTVYILGGTSAVSQTTEDSLRAAGYTVTRLAGGDRFGTALTIAKQFGTTSQVIVATGHDFPDALSAGPLGAVENAPIVLSDGTALSADTAAFVRGHTAIEAVGGQAVRAVTALGTAGRAFTPLAGGDRYSTSQAVAARVVAEAGHAATRIGIASGSVFPDALTGGAYAANAGMPLLLTDPQTVPGPTASLLSSLAAQLQTVTIFGGPGAVSPTTEGEIAGIVHGRIS